VRAVRDRQIGESDAERSGRRNASPSGFGPAAMGSGGGVAGSR
jgi:hypothetical protein